MAKSSGKNLFTITAISFLIALITFIIFITIRSSGEDGLKLLMVLSAGAGLVSFIASIAALRSGAKQRAMLILMLLASLIIIGFYGALFVYKNFVEQGINEVMNAQ